MATFVVTHELGNYLGGGGGTGAIDLAQATNAVLADLTQIAATGGYAAATITTPTWAETGAGTGIWQFSCDPFSWTASGADFATGRYIYIYDDTPTSPADPLIGYLDYGTTFVVTNGSTLTVTPGANGVFRLTVS